MTEHGKAKVLFEEHIIVHVICEENIRLTIVHGISLSPRARLISDINVNNMRGVSGVLVKCSFAAANHCSDNRSPRKI